MIFFNINHLYYYLFFSNNNLSMGLGKWIAGALGWAMLGPIGGILGYYIASWMEQSAETAGGQ